MAGKQLIQKDLPEDMCSSELVASMMKFEGTPDEFLFSLMTKQCKLVEAKNAAMLIVDAEGRVTPKIIIPALESDTQQMPAWMQRALEKIPECLNSNQGIHFPYSESDLYGQPAAESIIIIPLRLEEGPNGVSVFYVKSQPFLDVVMERLELTTSVMNLYSAKHKLMSRQVDMARLKSAMGLLSNVNEQKRFEGAAMALCNEMASTWQLDRVGLGILEGRYVKLRAMSHTEKFSRKMDMVQRIEAVMEECFDQDIEIMYPEPAGATYVCRATKELAQNDSQCQVLALPLRDEKGECIGAIVVERNNDKIFDIQEVETIRLACDLCTSRISDLFEYDKWIGAKIAGTARKAFATVVGAKHTWIKIAAIFITIFILYALLAKGEYTADGEFEVRVVGSRVISAPYAGELSIDSVTVRPGDVVEKGVVLATLETIDLDKQLDEAKGEESKFDNKMKNAQREGKTAEADEAYAELKAVKARIKRLEYKKGKSEIKAIMRGRILTGDWKRNEGQLLEEGEELFRISPIGPKYEVDIFLPEDQVSNVKISQEGEMALEACPGEYMLFQVTHIVPVAEVRDGKNVFRVIGTLKDVPESIELRSGLSGMAKVNTGKRSYGWIWTRKMINWVRMKLWI